MIIENQTSRRTLLAGFGAGAALLALPGCAGGLGDGGFSFTDAIRRLLILSSERAFARLTADGGFWDDQVARVGLGTMLGTRGDVLSSILTSALFKSRLEGAVADVAIEGSERAAPLVADAVRVIGIENAVALVRGGPTAATAALRGELGFALVEAMVPELGRALRIAQDPLVAQTVSALTGTDIGGLARSLAGEIDDTIWAEIGREETRIRADPAATRDPVLAAVFGAAEL